MASFVGDTSRLFVAAIRENTIVRHIIVSNYFDSWTGVSQAGRAYSTIQTYFGDLTLLIVVSLAIWSISVFIGMKSPICFTLAWQMTNHSIIRKGSDVRVLVGSLHAITVVCEWNRDWREVRVGFGFAHFHHEQRQRCSAPPLHFLHVQAHHGYFHYTRSYDSLSQWCE